MQIYDIEIEYRAYDVSDKEIKNGRLVIRNQQNELKALANLGSHLKSKLDYYHRHEVTNLTKYNSLEQMQEDDIKKVFHFLFD